MGKQQETVITSIDTNSWDIWDRGETKRKHEREVNALIKKYEEEGYTVASVNTSESYQKWNCYDGGTTGVSVFDTRFVFKLKSQ